MLRTPPNPLCAFPCLTQSNPRILKLNKRQSKKKMMKNPWINHVPLCRNNNYGRSSSTVAAHHKHNLTTDPSAPTTAALQRFVAKISTAKGKEAATANTVEVVGSPIRRTRLLKMMSADKTTTTTTGAGSTATTTPTTTGGSSSSVIAKNLRNSANNHLLDNANNNSVSGLSSKQRNKRSMIHERENSTAASKISRRYASTTMAVQQKQKEPVHTSTLVVKKVMITPAINSKTYPGPKRSNF